MSSITMMSAWQILASAIFQVPDSAAEASRRFGQASPAAVLGDGVKIENAIVTPDQSCSEAVRVARKRGSSTAACITPGEAGRHPAGENFRAVSCAIGKVVYGRKDGCAFYTINFVIISTKTGAQAGTGIMGVAQKTRLRHDSRTWKHTVNLHLLKATGAVKKGVTAHLTMGCGKGSRGCKARLSGKSTKPVGGKKTSSFPFTITSPDKGTLTHREIPTIAIAHPLTANVAKAALAKFGAVRCDHNKKISPKAGCVYAGSPPTFTLSRKDKKVSTVALHIWKAQRKLIAGWGWKGHGPPLHRTMNAKTNSDNRKKACPRSRKRPAGKSCDEYPFASTLEGASLNSDFSWAWVTATHNSEAGGGGYQSRFYRENRVLDKDPFWVRIT